MAFGDVGESGKSAQHAKLVRVLAIFAKFALAKFAVEWPLLTFYSNSLKYEKLIVLEINYFFKK